MLSSARQGGTSSSTIRIAARGISSPELPGDFDPFREPYEHNQQALLLLSVFWCAEEPAIQIAHARALSIDYALLFLYISLLCYCVRVIRSIADGRTWRPVSR